LIVRKLRDEEYRECALEEIAKEPYPNFAEEHVRDETERLKRQDRWL